MKNVDYVCHQLEKIWLKSSDFLALTVCIFSSTLSNGLNLLNTNVYLQFILLLHLVFLVKT